MGNISFKNKIPEEYAYKLKKVLGNPTGYSKCSVIWEFEDKKPYIDVVVKDEYVKHTYPKEHYDFVYSRISLKPYIKAINENKVCDLKKVTGSIFIDTLKKEAWARCGGLTANDVSLAFIIDVLQNRTDATKNEYAKRIQNKIITRKELNLHKLEK